jgi:hypothetical protein
MYASYEMFLEAFYDNNKLIPHLGIIKDKTIKTEKDDDTQRRIFYFTLDDGKEYRISRTANYMDEKLLVGDSIKFYTKKQGWIFGSSVIDDYGGSFTSNNPNEVFEVISCKDNFVILDFAYNKEHLRRLLWMSPVFALFLFCLFYFNYPRNNSQHSEE